MQVSEVLKSDDIVKQNFEFISPPHLNNNLLKLSYILIFYVFSLGLRNNGIIVVKENITSRISSSNKDDYKNLSVAASICQ